MQLIARPHARRSTRKDASRLVHDRIPAQALPPEMGQVWVETALGAACPRRCRAGADRYDRPRVESLARQRPASGAHAPVQILCFFVFGRITCRGRGPLRLSSSSRAQVRSRTLRGSHDPCPSQSAEDTHAPCVPVALRTFSPSYCPLQRKDRITMPVPMRLRLKESFDCCRLHGVHVLMGGLVLSRCRLRNHPVCRLHPTQR